MLNNANSKKLILLKNILWRAVVCGLMMPGCVMLMGVFAFMYLGSDFVANLVGYQLSKDDVNGLIDLLNMLLASALAGIVFGVLYTVLESYVISRRAQGSVITQ